MIDSRADAQSRKQGRQALCVPASRRHEVNPIPTAEPCSQLARQRNADVADVVLAAGAEQFGAKAGRWQGIDPDAMNLRCIDLRWRPLDLDRVDFEAQPTCQGLFRLFLAKEELVRIQGQSVIFHALSRMLAQTTQLAASLFQSPCRILDYQACLRWQILGNGSHACVKSRRQRFDPKEGLAAAYMLEQAARLARRIG